MLVVKRPFSTEVALYTIYSATEALRSTSRALLDHHDLPRER